MKFSKLTEHQVSGTLFSVFDCVRRGKTGRHSETRRYRLAAGLHKHCENQKT